MAAEGSTKAIFAAMFANLGIAIAKFVAFLATRSSSMLAESIHSVADTSNQGLLLLGGRRARREATPEHPFGFGRERYFWSFVVALILFSLGGLFALYEGIEKIRHPHELASPGWAIGVLLLGLALESYSLYTAVEESNRLRGRQSWFAFVRHAKVPELPVVLLEDTGALIGLVLALIGVTVAALTGDPVWDALGTLAIGTLLVVIAIVLAIEMKSLLIGESASRRDLQALREALAATPGVTRVAQLRTQHLGPQQLLVAGQVELASDQTFADVTDTINAAEERMRAAVTTDCLIYLEPEVLATSDDPA